MRLMQRLLKSVASYRQKKKQSWNGRRKPRRFIWVSIISRGYNKIRQVQTTDEKESAEIAAGVENVGKYEETE